MNLDYFSQAIYRKINNSREELKSFYHEKKPNTYTKYFFIDDLLDPSITKEIYTSFPNKENLELRDTFREKKYTSQSFKSQILIDITYAFQEINVVKAIGEVTGIDHLIPDKSLYAGGISRMDKGHFLNPHIDNSHNANRSLYRRLNLLFYVTPGYEESFGGHLELWDKKAKSPIKIGSPFNRLVVMETNKNSWHSVDPVISDVKRCCISNYLFTEKSPNNNDYYHVTSFIGRPNQKFRRAYGRFDNFLRNAFVKITGFSRGENLIRK